MLFTPGCVACKFRLVQGRKICKEIKITPPFTWCLKKPLQSFTQHCFLCWFKIKIMCTCFISTIKLIFWVKFTLFRESIMSNNPFFASSFGLVPLHRWGMCWMTRLTFWSLEIASSKRLLHSITWWLPRPSSVTSTSQWFFVRSSFFFLASHLVCSCLVVFHLIESQFLGFVQIYDCCLFLLPEPAAWWDFMPFSLKNSNCAAEILPKKVAIEKQTKSQCWSA